MSNFEVWGYTVSAFVIGAISGVVHSALRNRGESAQPAEAKIANEETFRHTLAHFQKLDNTMKINGRQFRLQITTVPRVNSNEAWINHSYGYPNAPASMNIAYQKYIPSIPDSSAFPVQFKDSLREEVIQGIEKYKNHDLSVDTMARIYIAATTWVDEIGIAEAK